MSRVLKVKKLVSVLTTFMSKIGTRKEALKRIFYNYYPVQFKKNTNKTQIQALINSKSKVNAIYLIFAKQQGLPIRLTNIVV